MKRVVAAALLVLVVCGLCACKKAEKKPLMGLNSQTGAENNDGVSVTVHDCSQYSAQQMEKIYRWQQCPIEQSLYMLIYEETDIAARYNIPEVLDGYWTVDDYHNDADGTGGADAIAMRKTYNFVLFIYDNQQQTLYEIHYNNEE